MMRQSAWSWSRACAVLLVVSVALLAGIEAAVTKPPSAQSVPSVREMHPAFQNAGKKEGLEIWRVQDFKPVVWPKEEYGKFFSGDSYIVLKTVSNDKKKGTFSWDIHFWLGEKSTQDEQGTAAILAVALDDGLGGAPVQHREVENHESQQFLSYFPKGVRYQAGGVASGFNHVTTNAAGEKKLYQVKGKRNVRVRQVALDVKAMNKGDCFILDSGSEIYVYHGPNAGGTEKVKANEAAKVIRDQDHNGRGSVTILDFSSSEDDLNKFFQILGSGSPSQVPEQATGGDDQEFEKKQDATVALYKVTNEGGSLKSDKIAEKPLKQDMLKTDDVFILDTVTSGIFVWIGKKGNTEEKVEALKKAELFKAKNNTPSWTKVTMVVEGAEPAAFREYFSSPWQERSPSPTRRGSGGKH